MVDRRQVAQNERRGSWSRAQFDSIHLTEKVCPKSGLPIGREDATTHSADGERVPHFQERLLTSNELRHTPVVDGFQLAVGRDVE